jgi:hypothetical protein
MMLTSRSPGGHSASAARSNLHYFLYETPDELRTHLRDFVESVALGLNPRRPSVQPSGEATVLRGLRFEGVEGSLSPQPRRSPSSRRRRKEI